jgi:hypothetical protein
VSVVGEYRRILGDFVSAVRASPTVPAEHLASDFAAAEIERAGDVSRAAETALRLLANVSPDVIQGFPGPAEQARFVEMRDHLTAICRAILGRP